MPEGCLFGILRLVDDRRVVKKSDHTCGDVMEAADDSNLTGTIISFRIGLRSMMECKVLLTLMAATLSTNSWLLELRSLVSLFSL